MFSPPETPMNQTAPSIPEDGFLRQRELRRFVPWSRSTLYAKVRAGEFPAPIRLSANTSAWRVEDVREWIRTKSAQAKAA